MPLDIGFKKQYRKEKSNKAPKKEKQVDIENYFTNHKVHCSKVEKKVIDVLATISKNIDLLVIECPICYEEFPKHSMVVTGNCNHQFCRTCTEKLCEGRHSSFSCPLCRSTVTSIDKRENWRVPCTTVTLRTKSDGRSFNYRIRVLLMLMNAISPGNEEPSYRQIIAIWHELM